MYLMLSEDLPLRTTRMLGDFASDKVLPHRLGDLSGTRFTLLKLSDAVWFVADHACQVTEVQIDDEPTASWEQQTRSDEYGNTWTVVQLAAPAAPGARVTASGIGKRDARTGRLIENPADILEYIMALAGRAETFPQLRAEAAAESLALAGSLDEAKSIRSWLDDVCYSAGAVWTPSAARLYPTATVRGPVTELSRFQATKLEVSQDIEDTCDILRVRYNRDEHDDRALAYVELSARPHQYGGVPKEVTLPWLRTARNAETVGRRMMARMAGVTYVIDATAAGDTALAMRPCSWVRFVNHPGWPIDSTDPTCMLLAVSVDPDRVENEITLEVTRSSPAVVVSSYSVAVPIGLGAAVDIAIIAGIATLTVSDENGLPLRNAMVSLDGGVAKKTNEQGKVSFSVKPSTPPRKHQLAVEAPGFTPFLLDVFF